MKIDWTDPAVEDLERLHEYIARDSGYYARRFIAKILAVVDTLEDFPRKGRRVQEAHDEKIRELIFNNYRIIYRVEVERVLILGVIHCARDLIETEPKPWEEA